MINPDLDIAVYVQVLKGQLEFKYVSEKHAISNFCADKYASKSWTLAKLWAKILFRSQRQMVKWLFKLCLWPGLVLISPLKSSLREKKETKNKKTNILTNTPLILLNLGNRIFLIALDTKIPKLNDKKNIDIVLRILQENDITSKAILISLR